MIWFILLYLIPAVVMYGDAVAFFRHEARGFFNYEDRLMSVIIGLMWPISLPLAIRGEGLFSNGWKLW